MDRIMSVIIIIISLFWLNIWNSDTSGSAYLGTSFTTLSPPEGSSDSLWSFSRPEAEFRTFFYMFVFILIQLFNIFACTCNFLFLVLHHQRYAFKRQNISHVTVREAGIHPKQVTSSAQHTVHVLLFHFPDVKISKSSHVCQYLTWHFR